MKPMKIFSFFLAFFLLASFVLPFSAFAGEQADAAPADAAKADAALADASEGEYSQRIADKLGRGVENAFVGWLELPHQIVKTTREKNIGQGMTVGFGKGLFYTVERMGVGVYEVLTFPYPQKPIMPPTETWEW